MSEEDTSREARVWGESTKAPRWRASSLRYTRWPEVLEKTYRLMNPKALDVSERVLDLF